MGDGEAPPPGAPGEKEVRREAERLRRENERLRQEVQRAEEENRRLRDEKRGLEDRNRKLANEKRELEKRLASLLGSPAVLALSDKTAEAAGVPTSKVFYRRPTQPGPDGSVRRPGGQPGHKGHARKRPLPNRPPLEITLERCPTTGVRLPAPADWLERTITDLPSPTVDIYQERRARYHCPCGQRHEAESYFPAYQQWGPNLVAFVVHHRMLALSAEKIEALLHESYSLEVSPATILGMEQQAARLLGPRYEEIGQAVRAAAVVGADETGFRVGGKNGWLWTFTTMEEVLFEAARTRGASVPVRVLQGFDGYLVRDGWDPYDKVACRGHMLDLVHVNRWLERAEVKNRIEPRPLLKPVEAKLTRAGRPPTELIQFVDGVREVLREAVAFAEAQKPPGRRRRARAHRAFRRRLKRHLERPWRHPEAVRIAKELTLRLEMVFTFVLVPGVPFHNNDAELQIRQGVLHRKMSGGRRSRAGADTLARLLSVYQTCKKTGENFSGLVREAYAWGADRPPPARSGVPQT